MTDPRPIPGGRPTCTVLMEKLPQGWLEVSTALIDARYRRPCRCAVLLRKKRAKHAQQVPSKEAPTLSTTYPTVDATRPAPAFSIAPDISEALRNTGGYRVRARPSFFMRDWRIGLMLFGRAARMAHARAPALERAHDMSPSLDRLLAGGAQSFTFSFQIISGSLILTFISYPKVSSATVKRPSDIVKRIAAPTSCLMPNHAPVKAAMITKQVATPLPSAQ